MKKNDYKKICFDGIVANNPTLRLVLGTCATLALTTSAMNGIGMGLAVTVILLCSNVLVSLLRKVIPNEVRIPAFVLIIATFVTVVRMVLYAYLPDLYDSMGVFLPLIVVNCIILGRAESFASKNNILASAVDGVANGIGFTVALTIMGIIREFLGNASFFGIALPWDFKIGFFTSSAGAFFVYGICIALFNFIYSQVEISLAHGKARSRRQNLPKSPEELKETAQAQEEK